MNVKQIRDSILSNVQDQRLFLNDQTAGTGPDCIDAFLKDAFELNTLQITSFSMKLSEEVLTLTGNTAIRGEDGTLIITFTQKNQEIIFDCMLRFATSETELFHGQIIKLSHVDKHYSFSLSSPEIYSYEAKGDAIGEVSFDKLLTVLLQGFELPVIFPAFSVSSIGLSVGIKRGKTERSYGSVTSLTDLQITENFRIGRLGIEVNRLGAYFGLALRGSVMIGPICLPLIMRYRDSGFFLGVDTGSAGVEIPTLGQLAALAGAGDLSDMLPSDLTDLGSPRLMELTADIAADLSDIRSIRFEVQTTKPWKLFGIEKLSVSDIDIAFQFDMTREKTAVTGHLEGAVNICSFQVFLAAVKETPGESYVLKGYLPDKEELDLKQIINGLSELLGAGKITFPDAVPSVGLRHVAVSFDTGDHSFAAQASVYVTDKKPDSMIERFFRINADVSVESHIMDGKRSYEGSFQGTLLIGGQEFSVVYRMEQKGSSRLMAGWKSPEKESLLSLNNLLSQLGMEQIPELISNLEIELNQVEISCQLDERKMDFTVVSDRYGSLTFTVWEKDGKNQYFFRITCVKELCLKELPVIGTGFHLLDEVSIKNIAAVASTVDLPDKKINRGAALGGTVHMPSGEKEFLLQTEQKGKNSNGLDTAQEPLGEMTKWFAIEKNLGVFSFHRIGVTYRQGSVGFVLDASLQAGAVNISLSEGGLGFQLSDPSDLTWYLSGLGLSVQSGSLVVSGSFKRTGAEQEERYDGTIMVRAGEFSMFAIGSYANGSVFAYGVLCAAIGGPPVFFVTGAAVGFGYNRKLILPSIQELKDYPLVQGALGKINQDKLSEKMDSYITVEKEQYFAAAGVRFSSFKMVDSFALATVSFGKKMEIALLGLSEINVPANLKPGCDPIAHAQLALKAYLNPEKGILSIQAELTSESYILSRKCVLTGGFAFFLWFGGEHKGDFVITLGGYHRNYRKPEHYPDVPRLGFTWNITNNLVFSGELYFALTPAEIMAGGGIHAVYQSGALKAWFDARADFIIGWKPFYYDISIYVGLGASYRMFVLFGYVTFKLELSAALHIWGPEFTGIAEITWFIISFAIKFGNASQGKTYIDWDDFKASFLPHEKGAKADDIEPDSAENEILIPGTITVSEGLVSEGAESRDIMIVHPENLKLSVKSGVPWTKYAINMDSYTDTGETRLGILPMGEDKSLGNEAKVTIRREGTEKEEIVGFVFELIRENVPHAMWGKKEKVPAENNLIRNVVTGAFLMPEKQPEFFTVPSDYFLNLSDLSLYEKITKDFSWNEASPLKDPEQTEDNREIFFDTVMEQAVAQRRKSLIEDLNQYGFDLDEEVDLTRMKENTGQLFREDMKLKTLIG